MTASNSSKKEGFGPNNVPEGWDDACAYSNGECDPTKFAPDELETFYPEDIRYMDLRNAFLAGVRWKAKSSVETSVAPYAWTIPGDDTADVHGFISARINREGEFTKPLYAHPAPETTVKVVDWRASHELALDQRNRLAQYIVVNLGGEQRIRDHACPDCFPEGGDLVKYDFTCSYHLAVKFLGAVKAPAPRCPTHGVELAFDGDECWECKREA